MLSVTFTEKEVELVAELLEIERRELQPEIHRTDTARVRDELHERLRTVNRLIERVGEMREIAGTPEV